jgi:hypothetical protein
MVDAFESYDFCLSQDLGRLVDYHATILTETIFKQHVHINNRRRIYRPGDVDILYPEIHLRGIERSQLSYDKLADWTKMRLDDHRIANNCWHVIDATGVGQAVLNLMQDKKMSPIGVYMTSGDVSSKKSYGYTVPKSELIAVFQIVINRGLLKIPANMDPELRKQLDHEVANYIEKISKRTGNTSYEAAKEVDHDDLITSLMINCWWVLKANGYVIEVDRHPEQQKEDYNPLTWGL